MERAKRGRRPVRNQLNKIIKEIVQLIADDDPDRKALRGKQSLLEKVMNELEEWDLKVKAQFLEDDATDDMIDQEFQEIDRFRLLYLTTNNDIEEKLGSENDASFQEEESIPIEAKKRKFRLPEVKLKTFGGELKEWLGWWSQFEKIHNDEDFHATDKFQYLQLAMEAGSEAKDLIDGYPPTEANYEKAVEALKERYGRQDLLLQVYVRELLTLVITNVATKEKLTLSTLYLRLESHLRSLSALNLDKADPATWLYPLVESSLSEETLRAWQRSANSRLDGSNLVPAKSRLDMLMEFIKLEVQSEQQIMLAQQGFQQAKEAPTTSKRKQKSLMKTDDVPTAAGLISLQAAGCGFCGKMHDTEKCFKAKEMTMEDKNKLIREKRLCFQCLRMGHMKRKCRVRVRCTMCGGGHHPIVCPQLDRRQQHGAGENRNTESNSIPAKKRKFNNNSPKSEVEASASHQSYQQASNLCSRSVQLNTLKVVLEGKQGERVVVRLLCDSGSQRSYILTDTIKNVNCNWVDAEWLQNVLFGGDTTPPSKFNNYQVAIQGMNGVEMKLTMLAKDQISGDISEVPHGPWMKEFERRGIKFTDLGVGASPVEILIGNDYWGAIRTGKIVKLPTGVWAEETIFGWVLGGPFHEYPSVSMLGSVRSVSPHEIEKMWSLEAIGIRDPVEVKNAQQEEKEAMDHFAKTVSRSEDGRYIVTLPWRNDIDRLPYNKAVAVQRLKVTTFKLKREDKFKQYHDVFKGWEAEGLIIRVNEEKEGGLLIPHRPVFKNSSTTPVRPVFDASCKQGRSPSLNECLYKGPNLIELIPCLFLRFGEKKIGVSADIRKAFMMIVVRESDQPYQRFLWWEDETCVKMVVYQHVRVVFGFTCSPFLLGATLKHHFDSAKDKSMADKLQKCFYVDNLVSSVSTYHEYEDLQRRATCILLEAKMELRQWAATMKRDSEENRDSCSSRLESQPGACYAEKLMPILGLSWDRELDTLSVVIKDFEIGSFVTKRVMLSVVSRIFDPSGIVCPATVVPKMLVQEQWASKVGWDSPVPKEVDQKFRKWLAAVGCLSEIKVPRFCQLVTTTSREVHLFCDSSKDAMGGVGFLRTECSGEAAVQFLLAKSRLTPVKKPTIPRAELISCVIAVRLACTIRDALDCGRTTFHFWSDSSTALAWIKRAGDWGIFVTNRVKEILKTTTVDQWQHVPGSENPADLPSRGCTPSFLLRSKWWEGPCWLRGPKSGFPCGVVMTDEAEVTKEQKRTVSLMTAVAPAQPRFSSYVKNVRVWGWVLRFLDVYVTKKRNIKSSFLTMNEIREAEKIVLKKIQAESFPLNCVDVGGLNVMKDEEGILRLKTRLINRQDKHDFIYPVLLPKCHPLVDLLVRDLHLFHGHGGVHFLLSKLREKYWIVQSRRVVRRIVHGCTKCRRHASAKAEVDPAALPERRVSDGEPYKTTGVDLAGPLSLKNGQKAWVVLYTCAVYRCVALDVVTSLSTEAFLGSFERFVSEHGRPDTLYSDNGTNFVGAANMFHNLDWNDIQQQCDLKQITWIFNPPTAAWWGGWWERLVRVIKDLLKRMLGRAKLSYDELRTCLARVAATVNDRPLTLVSEDDDALVPLTPAMFTRCCRIGHVPELTYSENLQRSYAKMKELQALLQARFRKEYLSLLVCRADQKRKSQVQVGDVVLIGFDNRKRYEWPLGKIVELFPGADGKIRVVKVKTVNGVLTRPLQRIYPLEVSRQEEAISKSKAVPTRSESREDTCVTRAGRVVKQPVRYGQWLHLVK